MPRTLPILATCALAAIPLLALAAPRQTAPSVALATSRLTAKEAALPAPQTVATPDGLFSHKPYVQLGTQDKPGKTESLRLLWQTDATRKADFRVEVSPAGKNRWRRVVTAATPLAIPEAAPQTLYQATLTDLAPGELFDYRVLDGATPVFAARSRARRKSNDAHRFVVFGDCAQNSPGQKQVAFQTYQAQPDYVFITGDIVYGRGRASEYATKYFPVYNADVADPTVGAPLIRSTLFLGVVGNHDTAYGPMDKWPDGLAYFYYWSLPLNGVDLKPGQTNTPEVKNNPEGQAAMAAASGPTYPRMANYSFDYGGAHWTVIDSNVYANWADPNLRTWLEADLTQAKNARWRFVAFHHPGFHSSDKHQNEQRMRLLAPVFEKHKVDVVWSGHVHNYQRTHPMTFAPDAVPYKTEDEEKKIGKVPGKWTFDIKFDGVRVTRAAHPIYIVTGGGGAGLYDPEIESDKTRWQPFTARYAGTEHSFTLVDVKDKTLTVRQISGTGKELDAFTLSK